MPVGGARGGWALPPTVPNCLAAPDSLPPTAATGVQYNYDSIGAANTWFHPRWGTEKDLDTLNSNMIFVGTLIGMIGFGLAGDLVGRNSGLLVCMFIQVLFALLQGLAPWGNTTSVYIILIVMRTMIGVGAGGVYPLSAAKAAEDSTAVDPAKKATAAAWAFFWRNPGAIMVWVNVLIMNASAGKGVPSTGTQTGYDWSWRYILMFGCVAPTFAAIFMKLQPKAIATVEKVAVERWTTERISRASRASSALGGPATLPSNGATARSGLWQSIKEEPGVWLKFLGTAGGWFFFDIAFYGNHLLQFRVLKLIIPGSDVGVVAFENIGVDSVGIIFTLGIIPLLPRTGVRWMQVIGFTFTATMSLIIALGWANLRQKNGGILLGCYCLLYGSYWITNVTTYVMSALVFKPSIRSTLNGLSAASGKGAQRGRASQPAQTAAVRHLTPQLRPSH